MTREVRRLIRSLLLIAILATAMQATVLADQTCCDAGQPYITMVCDSWCQSGCSANSVIQLCSPSDDLICICDTEEYCDQIGACELE